MSIWERLFGTPEQAAETIDGADQIDMCSWMDDVSGGKHPPERCEHCAFDYDRFRCERKDMTLLEWLVQEVDG